MDNTIIRDAVIEKLKSKKNFDGKVIKEINGNYFSGADIVVGDGKENSEIYRILVVKHTPLIGEM